MGSTMGHRSARAGRSARGRALATPRARARSFALALTLVPLSGAAQELTLGAPDATLEEPFSLLRGALEMRDSRLLVTDWIEQRLALVDFANGRITESGRVGAGPTEFRLPSTLLPWPGDSAIMVDAGNARLAVIDANGAVARTFQPAVPSAVAAAAADARGRLYFTVPPWRMRVPLPGDSVQLARWDASTNTLDIVARIHGSTPAPGNNRSPTPRVPFVVFAAQDAFAVAPDGRVVIARDRDYHLEMRADGRSTAGPATTVEYTRADDAERSAFVRSFLQASPMSGRGEGGGLGHTPASLLAAEAVAGVIRVSAFAETLPAFRPGTMHVDAHGRTWVERWLPAGQPAAHDVFDERGSRIATVRLPAGLRLLTIGRAHVYLVATDPNGLQTIERYLWPTPLRGNDGIN